MKGGENLEKTFKIILDGKSDPNRMVTKVSTTRDGPAKLQNMAWIFLTAIAEGGPWASDWAWLNNGWGPLAKNQPEPVTGPWVYTETVYLFSTVGWKFSYTSNNYCKKSYTTSKYDVSNNISVQNYSNICEKSSKTPSLPRATSECGISNNTSVQSFSHTHKKLYSYNIYQSDGVDTGSEGSSDDDSAHEEANDTE